MNISLPFWKLSFRRAFTFWVELHLILQSLLKRGCYWNWSKLVFLGSDVSGISGSKYYGMYQGLFNYFLAGGTCAVLFLSYRGTPSSPFLIPAEIWLRLLFRKTVSRHHPSLFCTLEYYFRSISRRPLNGRHLDCIDFCFYRLNAAAAYIAGVCHCTPFI